MQAFSEAVRQQIQTLLESVRQCTNLLNRHQTQRAIHERKVQLLSPQLHWRDRYLRGWFGGNKAIAKSHRRHLRKLHQLTIQISGHAARLQALNNQIDNLIDAELQRTNSQYSCLLRALGRYGQVLHICGAALEQLRSRDIRQVKLSAHQLQAALAHDPAIDQALLRQLPNEFIATDPSGQEAQIAQAISAIRHIQVQINCRYQAAAKHRQHYLQAAREQ